MGGPKLTFGAGVADDSGAGAQRQFSTAEVPRHCGTRSRRQARATRQDARASRLGLIRRRALAVADLTIRVSGQCGGARQEQRAGRNDLPHVLHESPLPVLLPAEGRLRASQRRRSSNIFLSARRPSAALPTYPASNIMSPLCRSRNANRYGVSTTMRSASSATTERATTTAGAATAADWFRRWLVRPLRRNSATRSHSSRPLAFPIAPFAAAICNGSLTSIRDVA